MSIYIDITFCLQYTLTINAIDGQKMKMYTVKIMIATPREIKSIQNKLCMDLWEGVRVNTKKLAESIAIKAYNIEPFVDIEIIED